MGWATYTDEELKQKGYCIPVFRAIEAAGGPAKVAQEFGYKSREMVYRWCRRNGVAIKSTDIPKLCELGGNKVSPMEILDALNARHS